MLRTVAGDLADALLDAFPPTRPYDRAAFAQPPMPPPVVAFLKRTLEHRLDLDASPPFDGAQWYDLDHPGIDVAYAELRRALAPQVRFPAEVWPEAVREAAWQTLRCLVEPVEAFSDFVFEDEGGALRSTTVLKRQRYIDVYPYFADVLERHVEREELDRLSRSRYGRILREIDRRTTEGYDGEAWARHLAPLFETCRPLPTTEGDAVPVPLLRRFFEEKDQDAFAGRLAELELRGDEALTARALSDLLDDVLAPPEPEPEPQEESQPEEPEADTTLTPVEPPKVERHYQATPPPRPTDEEPPEPEPEAPADEEETPDLEEHVEPRPPAAEARAEVEEEDEEPEARRMIFPRESEKKPTPAPTRPEPAEPASPPAAEPAPPAAEEDEHDEKPQPLWMRFRKGTEAPAAPQGDASVDEAQPLWHRFRPKEMAPEDVPDDELAVLERRVLGKEGPGQRTRYVGDLFQGDEVAYHEVLAHLQTLRSWREASQVIARDVFREHGVNIYSDTAVRFTEAVERRFPS